MGWVADAVTSHFQRLNTAAGQSVVYSRSGVGSVTLTAVVARPEYRTDEQTGLVDRVVGRDYIVRRTDLKIGATQLTPKRGDRITQTIGGEEVISEVMPDGGIPHYEECDEFGNAWRIHTKFAEVGS